VVDEKYVLSSGQSSIVFESLNRVRDLVGRLATDHREIHCTVSKVGKAIDRVSPSLLITRFVLNLIFGVLMKLNVEF